MTGSKRVARLPIGDGEIVSLVDMHASLGPLTENFPDVPVSEWNSFRSRFEEVFGRGEEFAPPFGSFLVRQSDVTILVDTGVGPAGNDFVPDHDGVLLDRMQEVEVDPSDVDIVFLTHLHVDHVGWNVIDDEPAFASARYVTSKTGWDWTLSTYAARDYVQRQLRPLLASERLELIDGPTELVAGVRTIPTPGHFPGHCSVEITAAGTRVVILGDVAVHPAQPTNPDWEYVWDEDAAAAARTRRGLIPELTRPDTFVLCGHYPNGGIGRLVERDGVYWEAVPVNP